MGSVKVALFIPCYVDLIYPEVGVSVVRVLRRLGVDLVYPEGPTCCGQPASNSGFCAKPRAARPLTLPRRPALRRATGLQRGLLRPGPCGRTSSPRCLRE